MAMAVCNVALKGVGAARLPARQPRKVMAVRAQAKENVQEAIVKSTALAGLSAALLSAGSAQAAMEVANIAASDNRFGTIALLAVPVLGWVGFNILGPLQNQLSAMGEKDSAPSKKKRGVAAAVGLGAASLLAAQSAEAAQQVADLAASDNRLGTIAVLAVPVLGWVGFNILGPLQNQLSAMGEQQASSGKKRGVAAAVGLGAASLLAAQSAEAAQQVADLAASDNRLGTIAVLAVPVLGWVGFNILGPLQNQLSAMGEQPASSGKKRGVAAAVGLGAASLLAAQSAEAAQQVADLAASDNRLGTIALLALPVLGWVGFNILGPLQNQLNAMGEKDSAPSKKKRGVAAAVGLGAASLLAAQSAEAAQQVADLAASDNRLGTIAVLAVPVLGWVGFNILGPLQNQLAAMDSKK
ncbi:hypothetical protein ABPG77_008299 [Micractinium sp. CCAP 211/92]